MILDDIIARTRADLADRKQRRPAASLPVDSAPPVRDFRGALAGEGLAVIAEVKKASPSAGVIRADFDPEALARAYCAAGAAAVSVLTEPHYFQGAGDHLQRVRGAVDVPVLRKDFVIDPYQVREARSWGADAVLLIACALDRDTLAALHGEVTGLGMAALVEVHDAADLEKIAGLAVDLVGVNNRDLQTLAVDLATSVRLRAALPSGTMTVSESGIRSGDDLARLAKAGYDAVLVGEALLRADAPGAMLAQWRAG